MEREEMLGTEEEIDVGIFLNVQKLINHYFWEHWNQESSDFLLSVVRCSKFKNRVDWKKVQKLIPGVDLKYLKHRYYYLKRRRKVN